MGSIEFTSTDNKVIEINISVKSYDPQTETFLDTKPFIGISKSKYSVKPNETVQIEYAVSIPQEQPQGSYFNVIAVEPIQNSLPKDGNVNVNISNGYGSLFALHIEDAQTNIDKVFIDQSDTQLIITKRGFPFLGKMEITYIYENKSNFVFRPQGEIRVLNKDGKQVVERIEINPESKAVYPNQKVEVKKSVNVWDNLDKVLETKIVTARTYNGFTENYLTNQVEVSLKEPIFLLGTVSVVALLSIVVVAIKAIFGKKEKRSKTESEQ